MNITVYLGANEGNDPSLRKAVRELGTWIGESGNRLVYGGSKSGLMGEIAESVLQAGGEVTGVEPQFFIDMEYQYDAITELIVTKDMTERKTKMIELGDVFIAFPGGTGTLEEIAEVMSKVSLKHLEAPCILYNLNGYYDSLKALLSHMTEKGLSSPERQEGIYFARDLSEIRKIIENQRSNATTTPPENGEHAFKITITTRPRITRITPVTRFRVLGVALLANSAAIRAQIRVNTTHRIHTVQSGMPPMAKWEAAPVNAVNAMMKTLVPTAVFSS